ncbi:MAG: hypothetical protein HYT80_05900 [Euryarchaeota archaeon]|nr:hypothetical protein [Euryarchaeota archaeon]
MLFVVVVCPACKRVQVAEARTARPSCRACGKPFELTSRKAFYQGEDADEARRVAAKVALQVGGAGIEAVAESAAASERERVASLEDVVRALSRRAEFTAEDVTDELRRLRVTSTAERVVEALRRENRLYEPRSGRFRWVSSLDA